MIRFSAARLRHQHPMFAGIAEGLASAVALLVVLGISQQLWSIASWGLLVWAALAYRRRLPYQMSSALVLALVQDVASGHRFGISLVSFAVALLAANLWKRGAEQRWRPGHALFALVAIGGGWIGAFAASLLFNGADPGLPSLAIIGGTFVVFLAGSAIAFVATKLRGGKRTRRGAPFSLARFER